MPLQTDTSEAWKQYEALNGLYVFYVDQVIKFHTFYFAITGALISFVLVAPDPRVWLALLLPITISGGCVVTFAFGIRKAGELKDEARKIAIMLGFMRTHMEILQFLCGTFLIVHLLICGGLALLVIDGSFGALPGQLGSSFRQDAPATR
jgi:hypothetical protein